jgi:putative endopeptidase
MRQGISVKVKFMGEKTNRKSRLREIGFNTKFMDTSKDPFEDFYLYSVGNWIKTHEIPKDKVDIGSFDDLYDTNMLLLKEIAESSSKKQKRTDIEQKVGDFYASFMDNATIEKLKFKPLMPILKKIRDMKDKRELPKILAELSKIGVSAFFTVYVSSDLKDSSVYSLYTWQSGISLPDRDYYIKEMFSKIRDEYVNHIKRTFALYGAKSTAAQKDAKESERIEELIAKAQRSRVDLRDDLKNYNRMSPKQISSRYKALNLAEFYKQIGVKGLKYVIIGQPEFLDRMDKLVSSLNIDSIKAYLTWKVIHSYSGVMHKSLYNEYFDFFGRQLSGQKEPRKRWKRAVSLVDASIGEALGKLYVEKYFDEESKKKAEALVSNLMASFEERIKRLDWMGADTKKKALEKLKAINRKIGYPKKFKNYSKVEIRKGDLIGNMQRSYEFEFKRDISRIGKKVDKNEWDMTPPTVNAYYNSSLNEIVFPAGIFQPPFFDPNMDDAVNYAGIGGVIGHEMTHGFDDQGRRYDKYGNLKEWWSKDDEKRFKAKAYKIANLYSSLEVMPGLHVNGKLTLGENIADLGGVRIAYDALQKSLKGKSKIIDGLTPEQRFFIAWAQIYKDKTTTDRVKQLIIIDPHSPNKFRGLIPAVTHPQFVNTFKKISKLKKPKKQYKDVNLW